MTTGRLLRVVPDGTAWKRWAIAIRANLSFAPLMLANILLWVVLPRRRFFEHDDVPGSVLLEKNFNVILSELEPLMKDRSRMPAFQEFEPGQSRLSPDEKWKLFVLRLYGVDAAKNRAICPRTSDVIDAVPGLTTAMFSVLEPGTHIAAHTGPYKGVVRYHLPLIVPRSPECRIKIGGVVTGWEAGRALLFDDTYIHSAWNDTDEARVVLFVDIERPMPWNWLTRLNRWVLSVLARTDRIRSAVARADGFDRDVLVAAGVLASQRAHHC